MGLGSEIGTVQVGKRANLLLLREDPTCTIQAYDEIVKVILHGRVLDRSPRLPQAALRGLVPWIELHAVPAPGQKGTFDTGGVLGEVFREVVFLLQSIGCTLAFAIVTLSNFFDGL